MIDIGASPKANERILFQSKHGVTSSGRDLASQIPSVHRTLALALVLWIVSGCSAVPDEIVLVVESTPSGANVVSSDGWQCSTPCTRNVPRDSQIDLKLDQQGYESIEQTIEIPELKPSRVGTYIGAGVGVLSGLSAIEIGEALGTVVLALFSFGKAEPVEFSTGEKFRIMAQTVLIYGGIGYAIDRVRDNTRAKRPHRVVVVMVEQSSDSDHSQSEAVR